MIGEKFPLFSIGIYALALAGCVNGNDIHLAEGFYQGVEISQSYARPVVAQVPQAGNGFSIEIATPIASVKSRIATLQSADNQRMFLNIPEVGQGYVDLLGSADQSCVQGVWNDHLQLKVCVNADKFDLETTDYELHLRKSDAIDPLGSGHAYTLDELLGRAKYANFTVMQGAQSVFRAKKEIEVAQGELLPHFNTRDILGYATNGPIGILETVGDLIPFIFPSNWYHWQVTKNLYTAERYSFAALRGNQMNAVEGMFYIVCRDQSLLAIMDKHLEWMNQLHQAVAIKEKNNALPAGSADGFNLLLVSMGQDRIQLKKWVDSELNALAFSVNLSSPTEHLSLVEEPLPDPSQISKINANEVSQTAGARSLEAKTLDSLFQAAENSENAIPFGFLDPTTDQVLGFGTAAQIEISKSNQKDLLRKKAELNSQFAQKSSDIASEEEALLNYYTLSVSGLNSANAQMNRALGRLTNGEDFLDDPSFMDNFTSLLVQIFKYQANVLSSRYEALIIQSKLNRILLQGYYSDLELK